MKVAVKEALAEEEEKDEERKEKVTRFEENYGNVRI